MTVSKLLLSVFTRLMPWVVLATVIIVARWSALTTWAFVAPPAEVTVPTLKADASFSSSLADTTQDTSAASVSSAHLFGEAKEEVVVEEPVIEEAPETRLSLELQGVFAQDDPKSGSAVIAKKKSDGEYFHINDDIFGQATLVQVFEDRVILERNKQYETLRFDETPSNESFSTSARMNDDNTEEDSGAAEVNSSVENMVSSIREEAMNDPQGLINRMGLEATGDGYRVTRRARQLMALGLRAGDVVVAVNDTPVGNISQDQSMVDQVIAGGDVKIEIQRGSRRFTIYHSIPSF